jgi:hypothetical protein
VRSQPRATKSTSLDGGAETGFAGIALLGVNEIIFVGEQPRQIRDQPGCGSLRQEQLSWSTPGRCWFGRLTRRNGWGRAAKPQK